MSGFNLHQIPILIGLLLVTGVVIVTAVKAPPYTRSMKWRSMTISSVFNYPTFTLLIIVSIAVFFTMLFSGKVTTSGAQ